MRWTSVACASCLLPVLAGCSTARHAVTYVTQSVSPDPNWTQARRAGDDDLRRAGQASWEAVRAKHPQRAFSDEFRDGFVDGYADFLDRGESSQPPAVPPVPYGRYQKYFGPDGHSLVRDYYLGFQYGAEVATATGRRPATSLPALPTAPGEPVTRPGAQLSPPAGSKPPEMSQPRPLPDTGKFGEPRKSPDDPPPLLPPPAAGDGKGRTIPPLPKPEVPVIKPFNPDLTSGGRFAPIPVPPDPDRLPAPFPPLPVSEPIAVPLTVPRGEPTVTVPPILGPLPTPIPVLKVPASERTLSVLDNIPIVPLPHLPK